MIGSVRLFLIIAALFMPSHLFAAAAQTCGVLQDQAASTILKKANNLSDIYNINILYPGCLSGGGISEEVSDKIVRHLSQKWERSINEIQLNLADERFILFILDHIDSTTSPEELAAIRDKSRSQCPLGANDICRRIRAKAANALDG